MSRRKVLYDCYIKNYKIFLQIRPINLTADYYTKPVYDIRYIILVKSWKKADTVSTHNSNIFVRPKKV